MEKFWLVWKLGSKEIHMQYQLPCIFYKYSEAVHAAEAALKAEPKERFVILESMTYCQFFGIQWQDTVTRGA